MKEQSARKKTKRGKEKDVRGSSILSRCVSYTIFSFPASLIGISRCEKKEYRCGKKEKRLMGTMMERTNRDNRDGA